MKEYFKEQFSNIQKILYLSKIDLVRTYRGATLGWFWAIFKPSFAIFVYYFTFIIGLKVSKDIFGYPYFLWLTVGIVPWFFIRDILQQGVESILKYHYLVTKVKFPVSIIPTFSTLSNFIIHIILLILVFMCFLISKTKLSFYILQLPIYTILMFIFFNFLNLLLSSLSAISRDFCSFIKSFTTAIFWLSGIIYDIENIDIPILKKLFYFNPITFIVNGYRNCFIKHIWIWEQPIQFIIFAVMTIILILISTWIYKKVKKDIPDLL